MPELPEVETVVRNLRPQIIKKRIQSLSLSRGSRKTLDNISSVNLNRVIKGSRVCEVLRRGKYVVITLDKGVLVFHLRMTGHLIFQTARKEKVPYARADLNFEDGSCLSFKDVRRFGRIYYWENLTNLKLKLGVEPLTGAFNSRWLIKELGKRRRKIKPLLLDQSIIAGIGNIYADEALWAARIHPEIICSDISEEKVALLCREIKKILRKSIKFNGTTFLSFYFGEGEVGSFKDFLKVYGKDATPCLRCKKTKIEKIRVAQRGTHFCPFCQKVSG